MLTTGGCVSGGGGGGPLPGSTSRAARFQRSLVGAVSFSVTDCPDVIEGFVVPCTQNVFCVRASRYCDKRTWPAPTVRGVAVSQSLPAAIGQEPARSRSPQRLMRL